MEQLIIIYLPLLKSEHWGRTPGHLQDTAVKQEIAGSSGIQRNDLCLARDLESHGYQ